MRLALLGDVMLGRGVAAVAAQDPASVFEQLRPPLAAADLVLANLESPLTTRAHTAPGFALEADPDVAPLLASAGIDIVDLANNHATDAGPETVLDTMASVSAAGLRTVGAGANATAASEPLVVEVSDVRVGVLAFDLGGATAATEATAGVNSWDATRAEESVRALREQVDIVVVGVHGGVEYLPRPDPVFARVVEQLADWGADIVWGHGAHVAYPVVVRSEGRGAVIAPGLGNALFDQHLDGTNIGMVLEVMVDHSGVRAERTGAVHIAAGRSTFGGWDEPTGDAVQLEGGWWTPVQTVVEEEVRGCAGIDESVITAGLPTGATIVARDCGNVAGADQMVVAYWRPSTPELLQRAFPGHHWTTADGRSAHLAVMEPDGRMHWGAATLLAPVGQVVVCDTGLALGLAALDDPAIYAATAWTWHDFGFSTLPSLTAPQSIGCADANGDGRSEPLIRRTNEEQR